eukprot:427189-Rhodomonas_salina.1
MTNLLTARAVWLQRANIPREDEDQSQSGQTTPTHFSPVGSSLSDSPHIIDENDDGSSGTIALFHAKNAPSHPSLRSSAPERSHSPTPTRNKEHHPRSWEESPLPRSTIRDVVDGVLDDTDGASTSDDEEELAQDNEEDDDERRFIANPLLPEPEWTEERTEEDEDEECEGGMMERGGETAESSGGPRSDACMLRSNSELSLATSAGYTASRSISPRRPRKGGKRTTSPKPGTLEVVVRYRKWNPARDAAGSNLALHSAFDALST